MYPLRNHYIASLWSWSDESVGSNLYWKQQGYRKSSIWENLSHCVVEANRGRDRCRVPNSGNKKLLSNFYRKETILILSLSISVSPLSCPPPWSQIAHLCEMWKGFHSAQCLACHCLSEAWHCHSGTKSIVPWSIFPFHTFSLSFCVYINDW